MGGSTADTPASPEFLRASDAERDHAVSELRNEFAEGRLSHETFMYRMQSALDARNRDQLADLFTDLPPRRPDCWPGSGPSWGARSPSATGGQVPGGRSDPRIRRTAPWSRSSRTARGHAGRAARPPSPRPGAAVLPAGQRGRFTIGRTRDCDLCLTDLSVSRSTPCWCAARTAGYSATWVAQRHQAQRLAGPRARHGARGRPGGVRLGDGVHHPGPGGSGRPSRKGARSP